MSETELPPPGPALDMAVARKLGLYVVDEAWNCDIDPESGEIEPLSHKTPNFKEGYTGIQHLFHPVYLDNYWPIVDLGEGKFGHDYGNNDIEIIWPPQVPKHDKFMRGPECHHLKPVKPYSTKWQAAGKLLDYITEKRPELLFTLTKYRYKQLYGAEFDGYKEYQASTAAHAICLSFLALPDEVTR